MAEFVGVGDLHLSDQTGDGGLSKYVENSDRVILNEVRRGPIKYAQENGIDKLFLYGDVCNGTRMSYQAMRELVALLNEYPDIEFHVILGNHDMFSELAENGHSLELLILFGLPNFRLYTEPTQVKIDRALVNFLPYPSTAFQPGHLNVFHNEVYGSKTDSGRVHKKEGSPKSKLIAVGGHLHTAHSVRNTHYSGTLYQTNFGESLPKYFHHINYRNDTDNEIELIEHDPRFKLHTVVISCRDDLATIPRGKRDLVKLVIQDGADVSAADYAGRQNIVIVKNFRSKEDLRAVLTEDLNNAEELVIQVDDFFDVWLEALDVEQSMREQIAMTRKRILNKVVK
ncbi:recombination endonuclease [Burkholderia phage BcepSauron]|uniref:Recombination endonuclease n=1 Tax=Burkholderia phage BcepSauron TaxID=2530033 RepID=A0A482MKJ9_9CAUD|nr:recombination endonuclease [Burkholderia phage BcepSauron]QBQ74571.1 recombination endonuclease [Burkholderia phage BcepSauron]